MRPEEEIVDRIRAVGPHDPWGWETDILVCALGWRTAKQNDFVADGIGRLDFINNPLLARTDDKIEANASGYMTFALQGAIEHDEMAVARSIQHYESWTWLLNRFDDVDWTDYKNMGVPIFRQINDLFGWTWPSWQSSTLDRMAAGKTCEPNCQEGCIE